jgi:hypothetical protein
MKRREAIILVIAAIALLYGALDYFVLSKKGPAGKEDAVTRELAKITAFATTAGAQLNSAAAAKKVFSNVDYLIAKAESSWPSDPFIVYENDKAGDLLTSEENIPDLFYTGFIQAGEKALAIINGMEYLPGEQIREIGFTVQSITASQVVLVTETSREIILQIEDN